METLIGILFPPNDIEKIYDDSMDTVSYTGEYPTTDMHYDDNTFVVEEMPQETPPSGPKF